MKAAAATRNSRYMAEIFVEKVGPMASDSFQSDSATKRLCLVVVWTDYRYPAARPTLPFIRPNDAGIALVLAGGSRLRFARGVDAPTLGRYWRRWNPRDAECTGRNVRDRTGPVHPCL